MKKQLNLNIFLAKIMRLLLVIGTKVFSILEKKNKQILNRGLILKLISFYLYDADLLCWRQASWRMYEPECI